MEFTISLESDVGKRLDRFLAENATELSRSRLQALIKEGAITLNSKGAKPRQSLSLGDQIVVKIPDPTPAEALPEDIPLDVLFEDEHLLVVNKDSGLVVHPAAGNWDGTLVNALLHHCRGRLASIGGVERPGIVHRLDKDTSGCLVVAKTDAVHQSLTEQFSSRQVSKFYLAVVKGRPPMDSGHLENQIARDPRNRQKMTVVMPPAGKLAITDYRVVMPMADSSLVECELHTGRTHQIRVHMRELGHPILGDPIYAKNSAGAPRLMLHAWKLGFKHPDSGEDLAFQSPIPDAFKPWIPKDF
ncbi:MAG: 23S rRNA pseudouridine1911/1915/1917 synthase [Verrucomicrobiales bacterium]|jgi:23S rRNA pseudouridine1911/1915/1917 synthase